MRKRTELKYQQRFISHRVNIQTPVTWYIYFFRWHSQVASIICLRSPGKITCFYQQCSQKANQSVFRQFLEFSKRLMLLSWLKWGQVYFWTLLHFTITSCPITPDNVYHCKRVESIQLRQKGWLVTPNRNRSRIKSKCSICSGLCQSYTSAEKKIGRLESYGVITSY